MNKIQQAKEDIIAATRDWLVVYDDENKHLKWSDAEAACDKLANAIRELNKAEEPDPWKLLEAYYDENLLEHMTSTARQEIVDAIRWGRENGKL